MTRLHVTRRLARSSLVGLLGALALSGVAAGSASAQGVFVNEFHYDNVDVDVDEGIEVAGPAGADLSAYSLELYSGFDGARYDTIALSGTLPDQENGYGTRFFAAPALQNGAPDGIALVGPSGVEGLVGYEGNFTATDGAAAGLSFVDIGRFEKPSTPVGSSLQRQGTGTTSADFAWQGPLAATPGRVNTGQRFPGPTTTPAPASTQSDPSPSPIAPADPELSEAVSPSEAALACTSRRLALIDVVSQGGRVKLFGAADRRLVGKTVRVVLSATGRVVARPRVRADGTFSAFAPLPDRSIRNTNGARYQALIGTERSLRLKLTRRMTVGSITSRAGAVTVTGRIARPLGRSQTITLQRRLSCTRYEPLARFKASSDGRFTITVAAPDRELAIYRLSTMVRATTSSPKLFPTFTLPRAANLR